MQFPSNHTQQKAPAAETTEAQQTKRQTPYGQYYTAGQAGNDRRGDGRRCEVSTLARNEQREQLRYTFTPAEREEKGRQLADSLNRQSIEEANLDRIKADFKAKLATIDEEVTSFKNSVLSGYELREYVCFWEYDAPAKGRKTLRRKEQPCDVVREEEMTEADRQTVMDAIEKESIAAQDSAAGGAIVPFTGQLAEHKNVTPAKPAEEDDELAWAKQLEAQRKERAKEDAEKKKASKGRRTSSGGVVGTEADGKDLTTEDDKKEGA